MSQLYPLSPFQTCLRQKGKSAWQKNVRTTFSRFSPSAVRPPSLLLVSFPSAPVKLGNLSKREEKTTQTGDKSKSSWIEVTPFRRSVPSSCSLAEAESFERPFPFVAVRLNRSQERCHLPFRHLSGLPARVMPWPWCTWVFGLCCGPETYCRGEASWSDTADFPLSSFYFVVRFYCISPEQ